MSGGPILDGELTGAVEAWLDRIRLRDTVFDQLGADLDLAAAVQQLVDDDRRREVRLGGEGRAVELDDVHLRVLGQGRDALGRVAKGGAVLGEPVQSEAGVDQL